MCFFPSITWPHSSPANPIILVPVGAVDVHRVRVLEYLLQPTFPVMPNAICIYVLKMGFFNWSKWFCIPKVVKSSKNKKQNITTEEKSAASLCLSKIHLCTNKLLSQLSQLHSVAQCAAVKVDIRQIHHSRTWPSEYEHCFRQSDEMSEHLFQLVCAKSIPADQFKWIAVSFFSLLSGE